MIMDGIFVHHLSNELNGQLINKRINKIYPLDNFSFLLNIQGRKQLFLSLHPDVCHLRLTEEEIIVSNKTFPLYNNLKRYLESSVIKNLEQIENDRIMKITLEASDDLGFRNTYYLFLEFFGRNSNLFLTDENLIIIDCLRKSYVLEDNNQRILVPKMKYTSPVDERINPFKTNEILDHNNYQGVSNLAYTEIVYQNDLNIIKQNPKPQIIKVKNKIYFYCFDLLHLDGEQIFYPTLSKLLEEYYFNLKQINTQNHEQKLLENYLKREIGKVRRKIQKQIQEKEKATKNLELENIGNLLSANLYKVQRHASEIVVEDFYNNNEKIVIELNPLLSPSKNLENIFNRYKKAKRASTLIDEQIIASRNELEYLEILENQVLLAKQHELKEIIDELGLVKNQNKKIRKKQKPQIESFLDKYNNSIWVGKNNIQNNYLTHEFAQKSDYFFHVKDIPGSHVIVRTNNLDDDLIQLAAQIAAYYSKSKYSSNVAVDYTLVRYVKRIPKMKGSFVTYTNHKTAYITPDLNFIEENTRNGK